MKKRILSCLMALALCLTLLPTAAFAEEPEGTAQTSPAVEEAADPANGKAKQENQPAEQEEQQEDSATKQDEDVAAVQAMIDALPDAAELDGMDDADALAVYEAFQTACDAYYDTLTEGQQAQLKNTEKLAALSDWFSQPETLATGEHRNHCVCGATHNNIGDHTAESQITFNKWLASTASRGYTLDVGGAGHSTDGDGQTLDSNNKYVLPADNLSADNYYLKGDVKVEHPIQIKGDVTICLNGHTIQSKAKNQPVFEVVSGSTLTLTDCQGNKGEVTHFSDGTGCGVEVNGGKFNLYGGSISGNTAAKDSEGGGVRVCDGEFNMYGGSITRNNAKVSGNEGKGGGVRVGNYDWKKGTFNLYGGEISDNEAEYGGGVYVYDGTFTMSGGKITGNTATSLGGGVCVDSNTSITFNMSGGEISGNNKASSGGGVYVGQGTFNMSGGKITGNTATKYGGGVHMVYGTFTVSGTAVIKDNKKDTANNNVYLLDNKYITVSGHLDNGASIGVTTKNEPAAGGSLIVIGKNLTDKDAEKFTSDLSGYAVSVNKNKDGLLLVKAHKHYLCGGNGCNGNGHTCQAVTFTAWTDSKKLPETKGEYYLDTDVTLSSTWTPASGTVLCLNGHSITANGSITAIYVNNAFTLCDCKGGKDAYGQITHTAGMTGSGVNVLSGGVFHMYGGSISGNTADNGGGVYMGGGQFTMYGGSITKNTATKNGGGVYVNSGCKFDMNGNASVSGNTTTTGNGGGVYVGGGTFTMNDTASVKDNTASGNTADQGNGGGVYVYSGTFEMNGSASVSSNKATNTDQRNTTYGGGVYVKSTNSTFTMNDKASITGNTAKNGGGVYVNTGSQFNMNGNASIKSNIGNGVCVSDRATFTVSDTPTVTGNTMNKDDSNVYLNGGAYITIGKFGLTDGASIGVTKTVDSGVIAKNVSADYSGKFFSDNSTYVVKHDAANKQLVLAEKSQTHTHSYNENTWSKDTTNHWHQCTDADCPNKSESIKDKAAHVYDNDADATCNVCGYDRTVTPGNIPVSGVALNTTTATLEVGKTTTLTATVEPSDATNNDVTWTSSNENVATVDANGTVKALAAGTTAITATAADGSGKYATCTVTVTGGTTPSQPGGGSSGGGGGSSSGSSSGGGGGSSSPSNHPVKAEVSKDPDGSVSLSKTSAAKGDKVTITVKPERHYEVDKVIVRDSKGKQLAVKDNGDGTFTFEMPADKVTVEPSFSWVNPFADVADSAYYVDAVEWMLKREVTQGTTETTFSPDLNCTRAQIVTFLWRVAGSPEAKGTVSFADVSADSYYAKAVAWAVENGITDGIGGGLFSPDATCTRAQSAVFLYRVAGSPAVNGSAGFSDVAADAYYAQAVAWAKEHGITDGIGGGLFGSANDCTRAQIAAFLYRYMK